MSAEQLPIVRTGVHGFARELMSWSGRVLSAYQRLRYRGWERPHWNPNGTTTEGRRKGGWKAVERCILGAGRAMELSSWQHQPIVPNVSSIRRVYIRESGDAYAHGRWTQTDLVGDHPAGPIKGFARGGDPVAAPPAQCAGYCHGRS